MTDANGVRAEIEVEEPTECPVATATAADGTTAESVTWSGGEDRVTEQFVVDGEGDVPGADPVFEYGSERVYQVDRETDNCVCERVEALGCPVGDVRVEDGSLRLTLHLQTVEELREAIAELREGYDGVSVRSLARTGGDRDREDLVPIDRSRLTDRQYEVLATATEMGYFEYPRKANASEVADALDIGPSTLIEHLTAAQSKLMDDLLDGR
jgi:predicted DNA binding protein